MKEAAVPDAEIIGLYIFYNLVYALSAYPLGILADRWGFKKMLIAGLFMFTVVQAGFAFASQWWAFIGLFFLYGIYAAATEGVAKAWISNISKKQDTATAIGTYSGFQSIAALIASSAGGLIWYYYGSVFTFVSAALVTLIVISYLYATPITEMETY